MIDPAAMASVSKVSEKTPAGVVSRVDALLNVSADARKPLTRTLLDLRIRAGEAVDVTVQPVVDLARSNRPLSE